MNKFLAAVMIFITGLSCFVYGSLSTFSLAFYGGGPCQTGKFIHLEWVNNGTTFRTYERFECVNDEIRWASHILTMSGVVLKTEPGSPAPGNTIQLVSDDNNIVVDTDGQYVYLSEGNKRRKMIYGLYPGRQKAFRSAILAPIGILLMIADLIYVLIAKVRPIRYSPPSTE